MRSALARKIQTCCSGDAKFFASLTEEAPKKVKTLRKQCAVVILTLTVAISAYAGQTNTPGYATDSATPPLTDVTTAVILTVVTTVP
jgi:hypothetical protein